MSLFSPCYINRSFFSLSFQHLTNTTYIILQLFSPTINTSSIPQTSCILKTSLPNIHASKCFNENKFAFSEEVKKTEIGHLFEHILLEYVYQHKTAKGYNNIIVKGETAWNWQKDPRGVFHIMINIGKKDKRIFSSALMQAIILLEKIMKTDPITMQIPKKPEPFTKQMAYLPSVEV